MGFSVKLSEINRMSLFKHQFSNVVLIEDTVSKQTNVENRPKIFLKECQLVGGKPVGYLQSEAEGLNSILSPI